MLAANIEVKTSVLRIHETRFDARRFRLPAIVRLNRTFAGVDKLLDIRNLLTAIELSVRLLLQRVKRMTQQTGTRPYVEDFGESQSTRRRGTDYRSKSPKLLRFYLLFGVPECRKMQVCGCIVRDVPFPNDGSAFGRQLELPTVFCRCIKLYWPTFYSSCC